MGSYIKNLLSALFGRNPYKEEMAELRSRMEQAAENIGALQEKYYLCIGLKKQLEGTITSFQTLVENLRQRITEKDAIIARMNELSQGGQTGTEMNEHEE